MRKLTEQDMANVIGLNVSGYTVEQARIKGGNYSDSDHYGITLAKNSRGHYVTWQFHLNEGDKPSMYWGHYFGEGEEKALDDYNKRI